MKKRLHTIFSLFLLISFSGQSSAKSFIYLKFKWNQAELAVTICENRARPKSCCAAKCYLAKEIKKEEERQSGPSSPLKEKNEKNELRTGLIAFLFFPAEVDLLRRVIYNESFPKDYFRSVFHPPCI